MNNHLKYLCLIMTLPLAVKAFNPEELSAGFDEVRAKQGLTYESYHELEKQIKGAGKALVQANEALSEVESGQRDEAADKLKAQAKTILGKIVDAIRTLSGMERVEDNTDETKKAGWRVKRSVHVAKVTRFEEKAAALDTEVRGLEADIAAKKAANTQALTTVQAERDERLQKLETAWGKYKSEYEVELAALEAFLKKEKSGIQARYAQSKAALGKNDDAALAGLNKREIEAMEAAEAKNKKAVLALNMAFAEKKTVYEADVAKAKQDHETTRTELLATLAQELKVISGQISEKKKEAERLRTNADFWGSYYKPGEHGLAFETSGTYGSTVAGWTLGFAGSDPYYWPVPMAAVAEELDPVDQLVLMPFQGLLNKDGYAGCFVDENGNDELPVLTELIQKARNFQGFIAKVGKVAKPTAKPAATSMAARASYASAAARDGAPGSQGSTVKKKVVRQQGGKTVSPWTGMKR
ncbi:MAG: hypothetical protein CMM87_05890 [Rickettsiales bacterium]|nr:hypothetical protein [Rickettsiales bacterium]